jgi:DNA-binding MarR family transcriptional regulator
MTLDAQLAFADQVGRHFARHYGVPPMTGRVAGWLLVCDPPQPTAAEIADALRVSRSSVGSAISSLENWAFVARVRAPGERADRISVDPSFGAKSLESPTEYIAMSALARHGLETLRDEPPARRARLIELAAFADFLHERMPDLVTEWRARRDALRASGDLPADA